MRQWLIDKREALGLTRGEMAQMCYCSEKLLWMLENGRDITHPGIVAWIALRYGLTVDEFNDLVAEKRRVKKLPKPKKPVTKAEYFAALYARQYIYRRSKKR